MSTLVAHHVGILHQAAAAARSLPNSPPYASGPVTPSNTARKDKLRSVLASLRPPVSKQALDDAILTLDDDDLVSGLATLTSNEENDLRRAVAQTLLVSFYGQTMDTYLMEGTEAEMEAEWWGDLERSHRSLLWYLLATLPDRLQRLTAALFQSLRDHNLPIRPTSFAPRNIRRLLFQRESFSPSLLTTSLFPHLTARQGSHRTRASLILPPSPLALTRQECALRRKELEKVRDARAEILGRLASLRDSMKDALEGTNGTGLETAFNEMYAILTSEDIHGIPSFPSTPGPVLHGSSSSGSGSHVGQSGDFNVIQTHLRTLALNQLPSHIEAHRDIIQPLLRPSRLTLLWPRLALVPPAAILVMRYLQRGTIQESARQAWETVKGFWQGWLVEPINGILETVRSGSAGGMHLVSQEGVRADLESLERMALALGRDKLGYTPAQLQELSVQIRNGDLTPVLRVYEEDIKSPLKSAIGGSLIRALLIQIQKTKVDVDQAMMGIDKLLRSQELTFAFVGVAPALAIVYVVGGYLRGFLNTLGRGRLGGKNRIAGTWVALRRIERLLITQPEAQPSGSTSESPAVGQNGTVTPLTTGLLLLSLSHLHSYAEHHLPVRSRLREGFLSDVADLEDPSLGRVEKLRVVERMWRSWAGALGWEAVAAGRGL